MDTSATDVEDRSSTQPSRADDIAVAIAMLTRYYGQQSGWLATGFIDGNPSQAMMQTRWERYTPERAGLIVHTLAHWADIHGDVYISQCLHRIRRRTYATALPSAWIWVDDIPLASHPRPTILIETSSNNYQGLFALTYAIPVGERRALQRAARVAFGGDPASADAVKFFRPPLGFNTKANGRFPVRLVWMEVTS